MQSQAKRAKSIRTFVRNGFWHKWIFQQLKWHLKQHSDNIHFSILHLNKSTYVHVKWMWIGVGLGNLIAVVLLTNVINETLDVDIVDFFSLSRVLCSNFYVRFFTSTGMNGPTFVIKSIFFSSDMRNKMKTTILTGLQLIVCFVCFNSITIFYLIPNKKQVNTQSTTIKYLNWFGKLKCWMATG